MGRNKIEGRSGFIIFVLMAVLIAACDRGEGPWSVTVELSPETAQVHAGKSRTFTAKAVGEKEAGVTWSVAESNGGTITEQGVYTAPLTAGTFHVVATSVAFPAEHRSATVTVTFPSGALDPGFGSGGKVALPIGPAGSTERANALLLQPDGPEVKIIAAGSTTTGAGSDFALVRLNPDGTVDPTFSGGKPTVDFGGRQDFANSIARQLDGSLIVAGLSNNGANADFALARLTPDGALDPTFAGGTVVTDFGGHQDLINAVTVQPDGKVVAAGVSGTVLTSTQFALARYNADGSLDLSFGAGGTVTTTLGGNDSARAVALQPDGKIVAAGFSVKTPNPNTQFALARYNSDGSPDTTFGTAGQVITPVGPGNAQISSLAILPDGKIMAAGIASNGVNTDFALARYNPGGSLDPTFGTEGTILTDFNNGDDFINALEVLPDGRMIAAGAASNDFALARYNPDGTLDATFGSGGKVTTPIGSADDVATAIAVEPNGRMIAAGYTSTSPGTASGTVFSFVRYWP